VLDGERDERVGRFRPHELHLRALQHGVVDLQERRTLLPQKDRHRHRAPQLANVGTVGVKITTTLRREPRLIAGVEADKAEADETSRTIMPQ